MTEVDMGGGRKYSALTETGEVWGQKKVGREWPLVRLALNLRRMSALMAD